MHPHHPDRDDAGHGKACPVSKEIEKHSGVTTVRTLKHPFGVVLPRSPPQDSRGITEGSDHESSVQDSKAGGDGQGTKAFELPERLPASPLLAQKVLLHSAMDRMVRGFESDIGGFTEPADAPTIARLESPSRPPKRVSPSGLLRMGSVWTTPLPPSKTSTSKDPRAE